MAFHIMHTTKLYGHEEVTKFVTTAKSITAAHRTCDSLEKKMKTRPEIEYQFYYIDQK